MRDRKTLLEFAAPPVPLVHVGIVGLGHRGLIAVGRYALVDGAEIVAVADHRAEATAEANRLLADSHRSPAREYHGADAARQLMGDPNVDLVYICTDWRSHAALAVGAMEQGKHVAVEVPAAMTVADCERLIETALATRRHCMMLENCVYDTFASATRVMVAEGLLGDITHCEGAYIHDLSDEVAACGGLDGYWMARETLAQPGNAYPTHGIGSVALHLGLHRGDRLVSLTAMTSRGDGLHGRVSNTLIRTEMGRTLLLQHDIGTPRPYSRLQTLCGTRGFVQKYPLTTVQLQGMDAAATGDEALRLLEDYKELGVAEWIEDGVSKGSANTMNHAMDSRLIHCLREGLPLDMDVFDAAEWSAIIELSSQSVRLGGAPVPVPDFTRRHWQTLSRHTFY